MTVVWVILGLAVAVAAVVWIVMRGGGSSAKGMPTAQARRPASASPPSAAASGGAADRKVHWLIGTEGPTKGQTFHIGYRTATVGRAPTNLVQVEDGDVSRKHCQLVPRDGFLQVVDMQSQNGTFVNGAAVAQGRLGPGDELRVGTATFVYQPFAAFDENASLGRKKVDPSVVKSTTASKGGSLRLLVEAAIRESNGDLDAAATKLGIDKSILQKIVEREQISV